MRAVEDLPQKTKGESQAKSTSQRSISIHKGKPRRKRKMRSDKRSLMEKDSLTMNKSGSFLAPFMILLSSQVMKKGGSLNSGQERKRMNIMMKETLESSRKTYPDPAFLLL